MAEHPDRAETPAPQVRVRYWGAAKAAAGVADESVEDALDAVRARHVDEPGFDKVLSVCSFLVGEAPLGTRDPADVTVPDGAVLDVLPPYAGG